MWQWTTLPAALLGSTFCCICSWHLAGAKFLWRNIPYKTNPAVFQPHGFLSLRSRIAAAQTSDNFDWLWMGRSLIKYAQFLGVSSMS